MAGERRRDRGDPETVHLDKEEHAQAAHGPEAHEQGDNGAEEEKAVEREDRWRQRVRLSITARRVRIEPQKKRRSYIRRLERVMRTCDGIVADPETPEDVKVKALAVLIRAVKVCYDIVTDVEVELIEEQAEEIRRALEERRRRGQEPSQG